MMFDFSTQIIILTVLLSGLNLIVSFLLTKVFIKLAFKFNILDSAKSAPNRKFQKEAVPLLGGTGFIISSTFFCGIAWLVRKNWFSDLGLNLDFQRILTDLSELLGLNLQPFRLIWIFVAILIILVAGYFDDRYQFKSKVMILPTFIALSIAVLGGGLQISNISEPFNQYLPKGPYVSYFLAFLWVGLCLTATKFLDGHDGLVGTVGLISFCTIAWISTTENVQQPLIFILSLIWASGMLGFLPWNLPNAKVYLGEAGSQVIGFMIGVLSIISGAKVATTGLVIGWFILDILLVFSLRILSGNSPLKGDRRHWHHRLIDSGLNKWGVLLFTVVMILVSAFFAVTLRTEQKVYLLVGQAFALIMITLITTFLKRARS